MKVGCQLIVFGQKVKQAPAEVLDSLADAGYAGIEAGEPRDWAAPKELKMLLDDRELQFLGLHTDYSRLGAVDELVDQAKEVGCSYVIFSGVAQREGIAAYDQAADAFNEAAAVLARSGLVFAYHNHSWEFMEFDGVAGIDRLCERTDRALVKLCVDTYWVHDAGRSPADFIRERLERVALLHLKDRKDDAFVELGEGVLDFGAIVDAARQGDVKWLVVEQDTTRRPPEESVLVSRRYLMETLGI